MQNRSTLNGTFIKKNAEYKKFADKILDEMEANDDFERTIKYAQMARKIIDEYSIRLQARKVEVLARTITECYKRLANKKTLIDRISMDPESLDLHYINEKEKAVPKEKLSAGEKQLMVYAMTKKAGYLKNAYDITYENIVNLIDEQKASNVAYLGAFKEIDAPKGSSKRQKEETKKYNKRAKEERETALPPISNALYMNCELLFALADEMNIDESERKSIEKILHANGERIFLTKAVDDRFWFRDTHVQLDSSSINVTFDGESFSIPALYVSEHSSIVVTVKGESRTIRLDDWAVDEVKRPKKSQDCSEFTVVYKSKAGDKHKFVAGEVVTISITPDPAYPDDHYEFVYNVVESKMAGVLKNVKFERVEN